MTALLVLGLAAMAVLCGGWLAWFFRSFLAIVLVLVLGEWMEGWLRRRR